MYIYVPRSQMLMLELPAALRSVRVRRWSGRQRIAVVPAASSGRARDGGVRVEIIDSRVVSLWLQGEEDWSKGKRD